jgi:hypothetical protein
MADRAQAVHQQARPGHAGNPQLEVEGITLIDTRQPDAWRMTMDISGIGALLIVIADIYAIVMIVQSAARDIEKLLWVLVVLILPLIGVILWYLAGPGRKPF